jgi:hypothetical protein
MYKGDQAGEERSRKCEGSLVNTAHKNTTHNIYKFVVYFLLHVSAIHSNHYQIEYRYRRKTATEGA